MSMSYRGENYFNIMDSNYPRELTFCMIAHNGQKRKYTGDPYWTHPASVAYRLWCINAPYATIIAGLFHDVIEDTEVTYQEIAEEFGKHVADLVLEVTDVSKPDDGNREHRKAMDLEHISKASPMGKTIKLADLIDNSQSIVKYDRDFACVYLKEKKKTLAVLTEGDPGLFLQATEILDLSMQVLEEWKINKELKGLCGVSTNNPNFIG